ncbi:hypothetical protein B9479_003008 [Cryptococcus floricola]|uniref:Uncharacterized protein n=1 Tax=Cryptococcus floricola TaxID=2591691 RepID=A0A5D3B291_9TREE|nr:hypothetical protein B9479_003008 [Cryptococcus floricola]
MSNHSPYTPTAPSNPFAPPPPRSRDSGVSAIGALLSTPYDDSDDESNYGPSPKPAKRHPVARQGPTIGQGGMAAVAQNVKSFEGELDAGSGHHMGFTSPEIHSQAPFGHQPSLQPTNGLGLTASPPKPVRSYSNGPQPDYHVPMSGRVEPQRSNTAPMQHHYPPQPSPQRRPQPPGINTLPPPMPINLPAPASPIAPFLAAPPSPHFSPMSATSAPSSPVVGRPSSPSPSLARIPANARMSASSASIRGWDALAEKKAMFREGEDEVMSPFSTSRPRNKPSGLREGTRASGMDFWKRFSVADKLDQAEKKDGPSSDWLSKAQNNRGLIKKMVFGGLFLIVIIVAAIVVIVILLKQKNGSSSSDAQGNL